MRKDEEQERVKAWQNERKEFEAWLLSNGETNDENLAHLLEAVRVSVREELTDRQREVLSLWLEGHKQKEISQILGVARSTVSRTLHRSINTLHRFAKYADSSTLRSRRPEGVYLSQRGAKRT